MGKKQRCTLTLWRARSWRRGWTSTELLMKVLFSSMSYRTETCLEVKESWGCEISRWELFWKANLSLARLSKSLQETLFKKRRLSLSNSDVTRSLGLLTLLRKEKVEQGGWDGGDSSEVTDWGAAEGGGGGGGGEVVKVGFGEDGSAIEMDLGESIAKSPTQD